MKAKDVMLRIALIALVAISLIFTWIIWFNPAHLEHRATSNVSVKTATQSTTKKSKDTVYLPVAIYQQKDGSKHRLINDTHSMSGLMRKAMKAARVNKAKTVKTLDADQYAALLKQDNTVQMVYSDKMSWHLFNKTFFTKGAKHLGGEFEFTRIVVNMRHETVTLVNDSTRATRRLTFTIGPDYGKIAKAVKSANHKYLVEETRMHGREVALYPDGLEVQPFAYLVDSQGANHFVALLMGNKSTSTVDSKQNGDQTIYTVNNNNQRLTADKNDGQMRFDNFTTDGPKKTRQGVLTDAYNQMMTLQPAGMEGVRFTHYDTDEMTVTFRTYVAGLALFNQTMSGTVAVTRTNSSLSIEFSGANLSVPVPTRETPVKLPSTSTVLANVRAKGFTNSQIEDVQAGYRWEKDDDSTLVIDLVPTYYVCIAGSYYDYSDIMSGDVTTTTVAAKTSTGVNSGKVNSSGALTTP